MNNSKRHLFKEWKKAGIKANNPAWLKCFSVINITCKNDSLYEVQNENDADFSGKIDENQQAELTQTFKDLGVKVSLMT